MGCYFWGQCKNKGRLMLSPIMVMGLLGHFPRGADSPAVGQCASPPACIFIDIFILTGNISGQG